GGMTSWTYVRGEHRFVLRVSDPGLRPDLEELHQLMVDNLHGSARRALAQRLADLMQWRASPTVEAALEALDAADPVDRDRIHALFAWADLTEPSRWTPEAIVARHGEAAFSKAPMLRRWAEWFYQHEIRGESIKSIARRAFP